ncbi:MAG TPA: motility protein A [Desulfurobacteriaceae bacterium]|nr:motility protein A [Desulfurobacteriaceae bacterium]
MAEIGTVIGLLGSFGLIVSSMVMGGGVGVFINVPSILITVGGGLMATLASNPLPDFVRGLKAISKAFNPPIKDPEEIINTMVEIAKKARKEGILSLEAEIEKYYAVDPFLGIAMRMLIDGVEIDTIKLVMDNMYTALDDYLEAEVRVWDHATEYFPAFGMIGTLIGLVQMLNNLNDPSAIGPGMAVALLTTLYGAVLANTFSGPIAKKLKVFKNKDMKNKEIIYTGIEFVAKGENPKVIEQILRSYLEDTIINAKPE